MPYGITHLGQSVNVPAVGSGEAPLEGLPIRVSQTAGVTSMTMTITYDPTMLDVSEVRLGRDAPNGSQVEANLTVPGQITLAFFSLDPMTGLVWLGVEGRPESIPEFEGERVLILGPPVFATRSWDSNFFANIHDALRSAVRVVDVLTAEEVIDRLNRIRRAR